MRVNFWLFSQINTKPSSSTDFSLIGLNLTLNRGHGFSICRTRHELFWTRAGFNLGTQAKLTVFWQNQTRTSSVGKRVSFLYYLRGHISRSFFFPQSLPFTNFLLFPAFCPEPSTFVNICNV